MIDQDRFGHDITSLMETLRTKLGARGSSLHKRLRRAGRRLPKSGHRAGQVLTEAERWMAHPKLRARLDAGKIDAALTEINRQLEDVDPVDARKGMLLGMAGGLVFNLMIAVAVLIAVLRWRGLV